jgi:hypothetical protein
MGSICSMLSYTNVALEYMAIKMLSLDIIRP